jgi:hypothetical protein
VAVDEEDDVMEKSFPAPVSVTVCGLFAALSEIVRVPTLVPEAVGSKKTPIVQLVFGGTLFVQSLSKPKSTGLVIVLVIVSETVPVLLTVTVCGNPEVPTYWLGKVTVVGDRPTVTPMPPVKGTIWGLPMPLSVMLMSAIRVPAAVGVKVTLIVQLPPGGTDVSHVLISAKSPLLVPVIWIEVIVSAILPPLLRITF